MQTHQSQLLTEKDGQALATSMLNEIQSSEASAIDVFSMEAQYRDGKPQNNILLDYIKTVQARGSEAALAGFAAVLTDALAFSGTDIDLYQTLPSASIA